MNDRIRAAARLNDLRKRIEDGEAGEGVNWWEWYESKFVRSRKDAEKVMALARSDDPEGAIEQERAKQRERDRAKASRKKAESCGRTNSHSDEHEDDLVGRALDLVRAMTGEQQRDFVAQLRELIDV
jgi:hypothetical protein